MNSTSIGLALALACAPTAISAIVVDQPPAAGSLVSQDFPDMPADSTSCLDDFTITSALDLVSLVVFGQDSLAQPGPDVAVLARIFLAPDLTSTPLFTVSGVRTGDDLSFDMTGISLGPGTYWLSAQVSRPLASGDRWGWIVSSTANGQQAMLHNPGGGLGLGTEPISIGDLGSPAWDMAFRLEAVPAPGTLTGLALAGLVGRRRR